MRFFYFTAIVPDDYPMKHLIIFFAVVSVLLVAALAALIFILCKCVHTTPTVFSDQQDFIRVFVFFE